jgi:hypothetical protein
MSGDKGITIWLIGSTGGILLTLEAAKRNEALSSALLDPFAGKRSRSAR